jgi:glycosyltransferase involved in cell wall biosynthesis
LLGKVKHAQVQRLMQAADLFVSGSHAEGSGYALLEALACGVAPVVTDIPSFRALTDEGRIGALWPRGNPARLADALIRTATATPSKHDVRAWFESALSFEAVGRQWQAAYRQLLDERTAR